MELNRFSQRLTIIVTIALGLVAAIVLGKMTANGRMGPILMTGIGALGAWLLITLKERIWIVLLLAWPMSGQIRALQIPFGVRDIVVFYVFAGYLALIAFKIVKRKAQTSLIDLVMLSVILMLVIAFIRNPVGVEAFGSERVGGKPYFNVAMALLAYWILSRADLRGFSPWAIFAVVVIGRCFDGIAASLLAKFPELDTFVMEFYSCPIMTTGFTDVTTPFNPLAESSERLAYLGFLAYPIVIGLFAIARPLGWINVVRPWRPLALSIAIFLLMKSGFRSAFAGVVVIGAVSAFFRGGRAELLKTFGIGCLAVFLAVSFNGIVFDLPMSIQRTLSFLPGKWDPIAIADAKNSTDWRLVMWEDALFTDRYIENKIIGDGFGMKKSDYAMMEFFTRHGGNEGIRENMMISGHFHSGPVTTIRYVGFIGLFIYLTLIIMTAREAWKLCRAFEGTKYHIISLLIGLPLVVEPFMYVVIFGSFDTNLPEAIFGVAVLKALRNTLPEKAQAPRAELPPRMVVRTPLAAPRLTVS